MKKNEKIYGLAWTYCEDWEYKYRIYVFDNKEDAEKWLDIEECDVDEKEILSKDEAIKKIGERILEDGEEYSNWRHIK